MISINDKITAFRVEFIKRIFFKFHFQKFSFRSRIVSNNDFVKNFNFFYQF